MRAKWIHKPHHGKVLMKRSETDLPHSEEWRSVLTAVQGIDIRAIPPTRTHKGFVAYTDGACLNNPGGPAGWSALLWSALDSADGHVRKGAPCIECYGYIPLAPTTTNNRAEIAAVLAALSLAPPALPLTIYSDSEYVIKVAQGEYKKTKNPDLWEIYGKLERSRRETPLFLWVAGHTGHPHNDRADELAGLGAFNGDCTAYEKWRADHR
jgi:ribonuclease HI